MFPLSAMLLRRIDPIQLSAERYVIAALVLMGIVVLREGPRALRTEGRLRSIVPLGLAGFTGYNILTMFGVKLAGPQHAALLMATMPALTMLVQSVRSRVAPPAGRIPFVVAAFAGVALVICGSGSAGNAGSLAGDVALVAAALCWVAYTIGAGSVPGWSPLRYTALTAAAGASGLAAVAVLGIASGALRMPAAGTLIETAPAMAYMALIAGVYAVLAWTTGVRGLGPQRTALFINIVPIVTFTIAIALGARPTALEVSGALLTILALVGDNLVAARVAAPLARAA
jgi:drug/metabolite transporter (DMT)-like permease